MEITLHSLVIIFSNSSKTEYAFSLCYLAKYIVLLHCGLCILTTPGLSWETRWRKYRCCNALGLGEEYWCSSIKGNVFSSLSLFCGGDTYLFF